jgi:hypothetical protein
MTTDLPPEVAAELTPRVVVVGIAGSRPHTCLDSLHLTLKPVLLKVNFNPILQ